MYYEFYNENNTIAIINTVNKKDYFVELKNNHLLYSKRNNYNYFILNSINLEDLEKLKQKHTLLFIMKGDMVFTNFNIKIEDYVTMNEKSIHLFKDLSNDVLIINCNCLNKLKLSDILTNSYSVEQNVNYIRNNSLVSDINNYNPDKYLLSLKDNKYSFDVKKQISYFNNLFANEHKEPKIIISITTIPTRIKGLVNMVEGLLSSTVKPDKIIFTITNKYRLFGDSTKHIQHINEVLDEYIKSKLVHINLINIDKKDYNDYGPCNKWVGAFEYFKKDEFVDQFENDNYVFIVLDDDVIYYKNYLELLLSEHKLYPRHVITGYTSYSQHGKGLAVYVHKLSKKIPLLKGVNGTLLPKHLFCNIMNPEFKNVLNNGIKTLNTNDLVYQDDQIITTLLHYYGYNVRSVYDYLVKQGRRRSYHHNKNNDDKTIDWYGVSGLARSTKKNWYDPHMTGKFLRQFDLFYIHDKL